MKRLIFLTVFAGLGVMRLLADPAPEEFLEAKWGADVKSVREVIAKRPGATVHDGESSPSKLVFHGGTFAGLEVEHCILLIGERGFFHARLIAKLPPPGGAAFKKMKQLIAEKYGGGREEAVGSRPKAYLDWVRGEYVQGGASKPARGTTWNLQTSFTRQNIQIVCSPENEDRVRVEYHNVSLAKEPAASTKPGGGPAAKSDL